MIWNEPMETMPREDIRRLQFERLRQTLDHVYQNVAFIRQRFDATGVHPQDLHALDDLAQFPFTFKTDLRETYPFGLFAVPMNQVSRLHASSGTKGKATVVGYTRQDLEVWAEIVARSIACAGGKPGDILHNAYGYGLFTGGLDLHAGAERFGVTVVPASGGFTKRQVALLKDFGATGLCCTPSYALNIAEAMREDGLTKHDMKLKYGIFGAEPWSNAMRDRIESELGIDALDIYGLSEIMGPGVAMECREEKHGLHVWEDHFLMEIVDPDTGEPVPDGTYGELTFTSLSKQAFPLVRYRTGDLAAIIDEPCSCGRTHRRMTRIKGRTDDMVIVRGVNVFPQEVEAELLMMEALAPHYQMVITREQTLDQLEVHVEIAYGVEPSEETLSHLREDVMTRLYDRLGITTHVVLHPPLGIVRSEGKALRVVDQRGVQQPLQQPL